MEFTTLEQLGDLGEFVGAIGVIISLLYLATQVRQNTRSIKGSAYQTMYSSSIEMSALVSRDIDTATVFRKGLEGHDQLTQDELIQFSGIMQAQFSGFQMFYGMWRRGLIDDLEWQPVTSNIEFFLRRPGGIAWWQIRLQLDTHFTKFVEDEILGSGSNDRQDG